MTIKLKPCKYCGEIPKVAHHKPIYQMVEMWSVSCCNPNCEEEDRMRGGTGCYLTEQEAIEAWNTRNSEERKISRNKKLRR